MSIRYLVVSLLSLVVTACSLSSVEEKATQQTEASLVIKKEAVIDVPKRQISGDVAKIRKYYLIASVAESRGDYEKALDAYEVVLKEDPLQEDVRARVFSYYLSLGDIKQALHHSTYMENADNPSLLFLVLKSYDAAAEGALDDAYNYMHKAQEQMPRMLQLLLAEAYINIARGDHVEQSIQKLKDYKPEPNMSVYKYYHLGRMSERMGKLDVALEYYRSGYMMDHSSFALAESLVRMHLKLSQEQKAEEIINNYLRVNKDTLLVDHMKERITLELSQEKTKKELLKEDLAEVMLGLASSVSVRDLSVVGHQFLKLALFVDPSHSFAHYYVGVVLEEQGRYEQAIEHYQQIQSGQAPYLSSRVRIAEAMYEHNKQAEAIEMLEKINKKYPNRVAIQRSLAEMYFDSKMYAKALRSYDELLEKIERPSLNDAGLFFARGASYERLDDIDAAIKDLESALALRPNNPTILNYLGYMLVDANREIERALLMIKRALTLRPQDGAIIDSLGWAYYKLERYEEAVKFLELAVEYEPQDATINSHLGDVYEALGRKAEAMHQWQKASQMVIDDEEIRAHLENKLKSQHVKNEQKR